MADDGKITWSEGQRALISAIRLLDNKDVGSVIAQASIDDLEWFLQIIEYQLDETPRHVHDPVELERHLGWDRRVRTAVTTSLSQKRQAADARKRWRDPAVKLAWVVTVALIGIALKEVLLG